MLRLELYIIISTPVATRQEIAGHLEEHLEYQRELEQKGVLFAAGPVRRSRHASPLHGMIIVRAGSFAEAGTIAGSDPLHKRGLRSFEILLWTLNEGSLDLRISLSDQKVVFSPIAGGSPKTSGLSDVRTRPTITKGT